MPEISHHRVLHAAAMLLTAATFPLIFMGGLVTSHGAGMAVPDWPNSYGYNMFTFPPSQWVGGIWYEHVHRLWGSAVGFIAIVLCLNAFGPSRKASVRRLLGIIACSFAGLALISAVNISLLERASRVTHDTAKNLQHGIVGFASIALISTAAWLARTREPRAWIRWLCVVALVAVCVQGLLGGLRVTQVNLTLAIIHGCFAQVFFCLSAVIALVTSSWWKNAPDFSAITDRPRATALVRMGAACAAAILIQLVLGATMRHHGAGLAITDLPLAYGKLLPPTNAAELDAVNRYRAWQLHEKPVTLGQIWLHFGHRVGAIVVSGLVIVLIVQSLRREGASVKGHALLVGVLLCGQFTLGVLTVYLKKPADIASLHVATGALLLMSTVILTTRTVRLYSTHFRPASKMIAQAPAALAAL